MVNEWSAVPVIQSSYVPKGQTFIMGDGSIYIHPIPTKPKRRWWQRQKTVDRRFKETLEGDPWSRLGMISNIQL